MFMLSDFDDAAEFKNGKRRKALGRLITAGAILHHPGAAALELGSRGLMNLAGKGIGKAAKGVQKFRKRRRKKWR